MLENKEREDSRLSGISNAVYLVNNEKKELNDLYKNILTQLVNIWRKRLTNNAIRWSYFKDEHTCSDLGVEVPEDYKDINLSVGWSAKCVELLAMRSIYDGFSFRGEANEDLDKILKDNKFSMSYKMALPSELVYGCGFWTVTDGPNGYPIIRYFNATRASAVWDYDLRRIKYGFVITDFDTDSNGIDRPCTVELYTDDYNIQFRYIEERWYITKIYKHNYNRPMMVSMSYKPDDDRPFGKSRISKTVRGITDEMQRELLRTTMHSDVFSVPHRYLLGASEELFDQDKRKTYFSNMLLAQRDQNGDLPEYGQLPAASMQPHLDVMRNLASRFAAETNIAVSDLGIIHDNPSSAEALRASMENLCKEAEDLNESNSYTLCDIAYMVFMVSEKKSFDNLDDKIKYISVNWKNPFTPSIASQTDAMVKQASVCEWLVETEEYWRNCGYNDEQAKRLASRAHKFRVEERISQLDYKLNSGLENNTGQNIKNVPKTDKEVVEDVDNDKSTAISEL
ncbi:MAG: phage portal protein [Coriobacteriia bacterium]|nr:phage portal protein [Coriobacteriia bacterium]